MPQARFALEDLPATRWKNGGGRTREIVSWPPGGAGFDWRASVATIDADGPFSAYPGVDRSIALLSGAGVRLSCAQSGLRHALLRPGEPFAFAGELPLQAALVDGPTEDFNLMVRRGAGRGRLRAIEGPLAVAAATHGVWLVLAGRWQAAADDSWECGPGAGFWWADQALAPQLRPLTDGARLLLATLAPEPGA